MVHIVMIIIAIVTSTKLSNAGKSTFSECLNIPPADRLDCGTPGIPQTDCESIYLENSGCCYDDDMYLPAGTPWCFRGRSTVYQTVPTIITPTATRANPATAPATAPGPGFQITAGPLGNQPPQGAINPYGIVPTFQPQIPGVGQQFGSPLTQVPQNPFPATPAGGYGPTAPRPQNLQNLLDQLGIQVEGGSNGSPAAAPGTGALGTNIQPNPGPGQPAAEIYTQQEKTIAFCTFYKNGRFPSNLVDVFKSTLDQCNQISATASPAEANKIVQSEINRILAQNGRPTVGAATQAPAPVNPFGNLGGSSPFSSNTNALSSLLGQSSAPSGLSSLLGGNSNNALSSLLGQSSAPSGLSSLLGGNSNNALSSLLGQSSAPSGLSSLLGGNSNNALSSLLGQSSAPSGLSSLLGGNSNNALSSLLGQSSAPSGLSSLFGGNSNNALSSLLGQSSAPSGLSALLGGGSSQSSNLLSLLGSQSGGSSSSALLQNLLNNARPTPIPQVIGNQLPNFIGATKAPPYNPVLCQLLLSQSSSGSSYSSILRQNLLTKNGCLQNLLKNPLLFLQGGGLSSIRDILGPSLGITDSTTDEDTSDEATGALDPALIPPDTLTECLNRRVEFNTQGDCKVGVNVNIQTEQECLNIGCIYAPGQMCYKCPLIKSNSELNRADEKTCSVEKADRQDCGGFQNTFLLSTLLSSNNLFQARSGSVSSSSEASSNASSSSAHRRTTRQINLASLLGGGGGLPSLPGLGSLTGGLSSLTGGLGGLSSLTGGLGGLSSLTGGLGGLGGLGGSLGGLGGGYNNVILKSNCESRGCCWDSSNNFFTAQGACYEKAYPSTTSTPDCLEDFTCGVSDGIDPRVVGGTAVAARESRPWQALIRLSGNSAARCSGVVVCSQWIATSASCLLSMQLLSSPLGFVLDLKPQSIDLFVGTLDPFSPLTNGAQLTPVKIVPHPYYVVSQHVHDVAMIQVNQLLFAPNIKPVCMPANRASAVAEGTTIFVAGYGAATMTGMSQSLREIKLTVIALSKCRTVYGSALPVSGVFCAEPVTSGEDTCMGDGGSSAVTYDGTKFTVVGIHFAGSPNCSGSKPLVFLDVPIYRQWMLKTTNGCCTVFGGRGK